MGSSSSKLKKYLQHGDEFAAMQVYQSSPDLRENLDASASYGESHNHNTSLHYASKHGMKHLVRAFLSDHGGNPNKRNGDNETAMHCVCKVGKAKSPSTEERRAMCISLILMWRGPLMPNGEKERPQLNAQDNKGNTPLHFAAESGLRKCVELLVFQGSGLFMENKDKLTPCDLCVKNGYYDIASYLESRMVFADSDIAKEGEISGFMDNEMNEADSELYTGLRAQDLQEAKDQLLVETADMLHVPLFTAEALLRDNEWSKTLLLEKWMSNALQCCEVAGIAPPTSALQMCAPSPPVGEISSPTSALITPPPPPIIPGQSFNETGNNEGKMCEICFGDITVWELEAVGPSCGHQFCTSCWERYLSLKIQESGTHHILCPAVNCNILVDIDFIEKIVSPEIARKYLQFDIEAFVERNKTIKWCPLPGCGRAVRYPDAELHHHPHHYMNLPKTSHAVDCGNGHFFCWECLGEAHSPCSCEQWQEWQRKTAEIRPEELKISSGETEDAANFLWLMTNSKPCPNCKSPIQKNEGCNHMKCSKCKFVFCWVCLESWKKHSSTTGGYFRCNRYEAQGKADEKLGVLVTEASVRNQEMQELSKFIHYYTRWKNHQNSLNLEEPLMKRAKTKMAALAKALPSEEKKKKDSIEKGTRFIEEGIKELLKCRSVLCGSYIYGYYIQDDGYNKAIFEYMQNELEQVVEKLSEMVAREYLVTTRGQIIATTLLARKRRHKFVGAVGRGLLPQETPPALRKERGRRLIGVGPRSEAVAMDMLGKVFDQSHTWIQDRNAKRKSLSGFLDWDELDSDDEENSLNQALTLTILGKCGRKSCPRPRIRNPQTGVIYDSCFLHHPQQAKYSSGNTKRNCGGMWECCDSNIELLIALEISRLQMIEDEARRRQSWLQERSKEHREHRWSTSYLDSKDCLWNEETFEVDGPSSLPTAPSTSSGDLYGTYPKSANHTSKAQSGRLGLDARTLNRYPSESAWSSSAAAPYSSSSSQLSSTEIAVDYFLKKLSNNDICLKNLNVQQSHKVEKTLWCFPKKDSTISENRCNGPLPSSDHHGREFRRSQSLGDLTDRSSFDCDSIDQPHEEVLFQLSPSTARNHRPLPVEEATDTVISTEAIGELESSQMDLEVKGILDKETQSNPSFQLVIDDETGKASGERKTNQNKSNNLRIHISHAGGQVETQSSNECESETGIPKSPTLYISGVSICRSPEPQRSPTSLTVNKENRSPSLSLPPCCTPEPKRTSRFKSCPLLANMRSRSSSLIVPTPAKVCDHLDPNFAYGATDCTSPGDCLHWSSLSLQATRVSSPFLMPELRASRSASEPEKNRLVFQFPKSQTEAALSSILHVEESTLSSDDFHEALFLHKSSHKSSKRKKSKRERNRDKTTKADDLKKEVKGRAKVRDSSLNKEKHRDSKEMMEKHYESKEKRKH